MDVNCYHELDDASPETIGLVADLVEASRTDEQLVYREAEIDELWRWLGAGRTGGVEVPPDRLPAALDELVAIHDLLEDAGNTRLAAERLRALLPAAAPHHP